MPRSVDDFPPLISPAEPWFTSPREFRRWSALSIWASASAIRNEPMPPHSVVLSFIGACLLWVGWFGFNAGSALAAGSLATSAFVATHFAAAAAAIGWAGAEWIRNGKPSVLGGNLRGGCRTGGHHSCIRIRQPDVRPAHRLDRRSVLLLDGRQGESEIRL